MNFNIENLLRAKDWTPKAEIVWCQSKADGIRLAVTRYGDTAGGFSCWTRNGKTNFWSLLADTHIGQQIKRIPPGTILDCEIWVPGVQATEVKTHLLAKSSQLVLTPFAMPYYGGTDFRGQSNLDAINSILEGMRFVPPETRRLHSSPLCPEQSAIDALLAEARHRKLEGFVLKGGHYWNWYKLKPTRTLDAVVIYAERSTAMTIRGGLKNVHVGLYRDGKVVEIAAVSSGFTQGYRMEVDPKSLVGKVCEVEYDSIAGKGKLKFPRFLRWRDDKSASECTWEQIDGTVCND